MIQEILLFTGFFIISFVCVFVIKKINFQKGIQGIDINKEDQKVLPESTGIALLIPLFLITLYEVLVLKELNFIPWISLTTVFAFVGFFDDTRHKFKTKTLSWSIRAIPMAISSLLFAYIFSLEPAWLWFIPLALYISGIASYQNTLAGLNGLEIGSGFIISLFTSFILWNTPMKFAAIVLSAAILGLLAWNKFPAKVFPGDSGTLLIGSATATLFLLTKNFELILLGFLLYLPHMIDFFILKTLTSQGDKTQQKFRPYKLLKDNRLAIPSYPDGKIRYDLAKLVIKIFGPLKEWQIVLVLWVVVILNGLIMLFLFKKI